MKRFVLGFICALSLSLAPACGGDDDGSSDGAGADASTGGAAEAFCTSFGDVCGFGTGYADMAACVAAFNGYDTDRQACVATHLTYADDAADGSADETMHCGHAAGGAPCD
jgi:hypothetical protein